MESSNKNRLRKLDTYCEWMITVSTILGVIVTALWNKSEIYTNYSVLTIYGISIGLLFISSLTKYQLKTEKETPTQKFLKIIKSLSNIKLIFLSIMIAVLILFACLFKYLITNNVYNVFFLLIVSIITIMLFIFLTADLISFENSKTDYETVLLIFSIVIFSFSYPSRFWNIAIILISLFLLGYCFFYLFHKN